MSEKTQNTNAPIDKKVEGINTKKETLEGVVSQVFIYKKERYQVGQPFKTEDEKLFSKLLTTKRITK